MKKRYRWLLVLVILIIFIISPLFQFVRSLVVMRVYSLYEESYSLLKTEGIKLEIPGGISTMRKDWYPFVMVFNDSKGFSYYAGDQVELTILYNFGAYDYLEGRSTFYDVESDFYNAFYGAYVTKKEEGFYGFNEDGSLNYDEMAMVPKFDMTQLVLDDLGCEQPTFRFYVEREWTVEEYAGFEDWHVIDATITTNAPIHTFKEKKLGYIQYGRPPKDVNEEFPIIEVKGRVYAKAFEEEGVTIFFYVIAPSEKAIDTCDQEILMKSQLKFR